MLSFDDEPTIRWAIIKRLDKEPGIRVLEVRCKRHMEGTLEVIKVGVQVFIGDQITAISRFDLPGSFYHNQLLNEIDEMAEHFKQALLKFTLLGEGKERAASIAGNGLRGNWTFEDKPHAIVH